MMKLTFCGANRQVTGSCYHLDAGGLQIMIDAGLFQERQYQDRNWAQPPIKLSRVDHVLLTHAHLDHVGRLPKFVKDDLDCPIHATAPTVELAEIVLRDSARIQAEDVAYKKKRHRKENRTSPYPYAPLYEDRHVSNAMRRMQPHGLGQTVKLNDKVTATFYDAGHILGSTMIAVDVREDGRTRRVVFSGDIGQWNTPIIEDPTYLESADYLVMESTYGDRDHDRNQTIADQLAEVINRTFQRGGCVVIPTFAIERAQELIYYLSDLIHEKRIAPPPVYLDSPMAIRVTDVFRSHQQYFDDEAVARYTDGRKPLAFDGLQMTESPHDSRRINGVKSGAIILAGSGMCTGGRIKHHLRHHIDRPESTILFVGYQAHGTLGRLIVDGVSPVRIHNRPYDVRAEIARIEGLSAHADREDLLTWSGRMSPPPRRTFLTHGDEDAALALQATMAKRDDRQVDVPSYGDAVTLD